MFCPEVNFSNLFRIKTTARLVIEIFSHLMNLIKCLAKVNEASLMMRQPGGDSQMYRVPSFGDDPFDNDDEVGQKRKLDDQVSFGLHTK